MPLGYFVPSMGRTGPELRVARDTHELLATGPAARILVGGRIGAPSAKKAAIDKDSLGALLAVRPAPPHAHIQPVYMRRSHFLNALLNTDQLRHAFAGKPATRSLTPTCLASGQALA